MKTALLESRLLSLWKKKFRKIKYNFYADELCYRGDSCGICWEAIEKVFLGG